MSDDRMTKEEWEATVRKHNEAQARRSGVLNAGERAVREMYETQRPTLDPATQRLWDEYVDQRCKNIIQPRIESLASHIGAKVGKLVKTIRKEHADEITKLKKDFNAKIVKISKATGTRTGNVIDLPNPLVRKA